MSDWEEECQPPIGYKPESAVEKLHGKVICCCVSIYVGITRKVIDSLLNSYRSLTSQPSLIHTVRLR